MPTQTYDDHLSREVYRAARRGDLEQLQELRDSFPARVHAECEKCIVMAAKTDGNAHVLQWIFEELEEPAREKMTPAELEKSKDTWFRAATVAARNGDSETMHLALRCSGRELGHNHCELAYWCAYGGSTDILRHLKDSLDHPQYTNRCAVAAASQGHEDAVRYLVEECGCDPAWNKQDGLFQAVSRGHDKVEELLKGYLQERGQQELERVTRRRKTRKSVLARVQNRKSAAGRASLRRVSRQI